jgi:hypothetical protein
MPTGNRRDGAKGRRKPSRLLIAKRSRAARRGEQFIAAYGLPNYFPKRGPQAPAEPRGGRFFEQTFG